MGRVIKQWRRMLRSGKRVLREHTGGQSLVIVTFAFVGILAFVGLAVDLGWVFVERVRVAQAADAAALAGLPNCRWRGRLTRARWSTCRRMDTIILPATCDWSLMVSISRALQRGTRRLSFG